MRSQRESNRKVKILHPAARPPVLRAAMTRRAGPALPSLGGVGAYQRRVSPRGARALGTAETARFGSARFGPHGSGTAAPHHGGLCAAACRRRAPAASLPPRAWRAACASARPRGALLRPAHVRRRSSRPREPRTAGAAETGRRRDFSSRDPALRAVGHRSTSGTAFRPGLPPCLARAARPLGPTRPRSLRWRPPGGALAPYRSRCSRRLPSRRGPEPDPGRAEAGRGRPPGPAVAARPVPRGSRCPAGGRRGAVPCRAEPRSGVCVPGRGETPRGRGGVRHRERPRGVSACPDAFRVPPGRSLRPGPEAPSGIAPARGPGQTAGSRRRRAEGADGSDRSAARAAVPRGARSCPAPGQAVEHAAGGDGRVYAVYYECNQDYPTKRYMRSPPKLKNKNNNETPMCVHIRPRSHPTRTPHTRPARTRAALPLPPALPRAERGRLPRAQPRAALPGPGAGPRPPAAAQLALTHPPTQIIK